MFGLLAVELGFGFDLKRNLLGILAKKINEKCCILVAKKRKYFHKIIFSYCKMQNYILKNIGRSTLTCLLSSYETRKFIC